MNSTDGWQSGRCREIQSNSTVWTMLSRRYYQRDTVRIRSILSWILKLIVQCYCETIKASDRAIDGFMVSVYVFLVVMEKNEKLRPANFTVSRIWNWIQERSLELNSGLEG